MLSKIHSFSLDAGGTHKIEICNTARLVFLSASVRPSTIPRTHPRIEFITINSHSSCSVIHHHPSSARNHSTLIPEHLPSQVSCKRGLDPLGTPCGSFCASCKGVHATPRVHQVSIHCRRMRSRCLSFVFYMCVRLSWRRGKLD